jgi:peptidoglycan/xylan/chitin deacetylase (PgdA/CDA1 family)
MFNDRIIEAFRSTRKSEIDLTPLGLETYQIDSVAERQASIDKILDATKYLSVTERNERADRVLEIAGVAAPTQLMLKSSSVRSLLDFGIDVGAHTVNHPILARTPTEEAWREICDSKRRLEELFGKSIRLFAYPNGKPGEDYSPEHVRMVREAGFEAAASTGWGAATKDGDVFQLPRFTPWARQPLKFDLLMLRNLRHTVERRVA